MYNKIYNFIVVPLQTFIRKSPVVGLFIAYYFSCVAVGWAILQLPFCKKGFISGMDAFFMTASAVSTTGLVTIDVGKALSFPGQLVLLLLIQLGAIGYLVFSSFIFLTFKSRKTNFILTTLVKQVVAYTVICEIIGMIVLYLFFKNEGIENSIWNSIFHSISAFCTAGFSLFSSNLEEYKGHLGINVTLSLLSLFGAFGFFLSMNFVNRIKNTGFAARIVGAFATAAILIGTFLFLLTTTFGVTTSGFEKLIISAFQVVSTITTAGFNTIDIKALSQIASFLLIFLMICGVCLTGSGINMRGVSFRGLLKLMISKKTSGQWIRKILLKRGRIAISSFIYYFGVLLIFTFFLNLIEKHSFIPLFFETASALCTVGLSMGITAELSNLGKSLIILLMLVGRTGILIFGFAVSINKLSHLLLTLRTESGISAEPKPRG